MFKNTKIKIEYEKNKKKLIKKTEKMKKKLTIFFIFNDMYIHK